jgi:hypothetical protein
MVLVGLKLDARYGIDDRVLPAALEDSEPVTVVVKCVVFPAAQDWGAWRISVDLEAVNPAGMRHDCGHLVET